MSNMTELNRVLENFSQEKITKLVELLGAIAGDESNLKINFQDVKFIIGNVKVGINGDVGLDIVRELVAQEQTETGR